MIRFEIRRKDESGIDVIDAVGVQFDAIFPRDKGQCAVQWKRLGDVLVYKTVERALELHGKQGAYIEWLDTLTLPVISAENRNQLRPKFKSEQDALD